MNGLMSQTTSSHPAGIKRFLFGLVVVESIIAAAILINLPSDTGGFLGLSPLRWLLLSAIILPGIICLILSLPTTRNHLRIQFPDMDEPKAAMFIAMLIFIAILLMQLIFLLEDLYTGTGFYAYHAYAQRLSPVLVLYALLCFQSAGYLIFKKRQNFKFLPASEKPFLTSWGLTFFGLILLAALIAVNRLGLDPDPIGWGAPTVPLLEWQIWLAVVVCLLYRWFRNTLFFQRISGWLKDHPILSNWMISLAIWVFALFLWVSQPVPPGFFATSPRAPNFEIYPFSDAAFYDFHAQTLLIGEGYRGESIPPRPLYILFLAVTHLLVGQDYSQVILIQTGLLALFPVVTYWITRKLSSGVVGLVVSLFIILREWTSIVSTPFTSDISNSKLLFADLPAALMISLVLLLTIHWLQNPGKVISGLMAGGFLGISLLIRTQIIILLPVILLFYLLVCTRNRLPLRKWVLPIILFIFGFTLAVAPWLSRSYRITGQFVFDHPESQTRVMAQRYYPDVELTDFDRKPGESTGEYNKRLSAAIRDQILTHPDQVIHFMASHFLNSEIANLQIFPVRFSITSIDELVKPQHAFWEEWHGKANPRQLAVMLLNLAVLSAGMVYLVKINTWLGILPLIFNLAYHFSNAAARNSGWRYLLPADWIFLLYFAAGLFALIMLGTDFVKHTGKPADEKSTSLPVFKLSAILLSVFLIGCLPLFAEKAFPRLYPIATVENTRQSLNESADRLPIEVRDGLRSLLQDPQVVVMNGRMLYPRYYGEKEGEEKTGKTGYAPLPYARYVFLVAGNPEGTVIFPQTRADLPLRNAGDVILAGCMDGLAVKARLVVLPGVEPSAFSAEPPVAWNCASQP